jgi:dTDP-4-dehydrorhamnose 3,5-epimerase
VKFIKTSLPGVFIIEIEPIKDERGFFARSWCQQEFQRHGLDATIVQCGISLNKKRGTLRGLHYQDKPYEEVKLVRCTMGSIYDVVVDLRYNSPTFKQHLSVELNDLNYRMLYIPKGLAHGFQTLKDQTEVFYQMSQFFSKDHARGVRWNDSTFSIQWPLPITYISTKDRAYGDFVK